MPRSVHVHEAAPIRRIDLSAPSHRHRESLAGRCVLKASEAADRIKFRWIDVQAFVDDVIGDVDVDDFADHDVAAGGLAWVGADDLDRLAFVVDGRFENAGRFHDSAGGGRHACHVEFAFAVGEFFGGHGHGLGEGVGHDVDDELPCASLGCQSCVEQRVFFGAVGFVGGAEEQCHGVAADAREKGERGEVEFVVARDGADPGDGPWDDAADDEFVAFGDGEGGGGEFHWKCYGVESGTVEAS